jgi:hypothetical protein
MGLARIKRLWCAHFKMEVHPVTPLDTIGELFQRWAAEGR